MENANHERGVGMAQHSIKGDMRYLKDKLDQKEHAEWVVKMLKDKLTEPQKSFVRDNLT